MTWLLMRDILGDTDTEAFEEGWLRQVKREQDANSDGSFLGSRLASLENISPLYYTRLEGDKAASLSMACCWRRRFGEFKDAHATSNTPLLESWQDDFHGSLFTRSEKRIASWTWAASEPPMGLCLPTDRSDLAEWLHNLAGELRVFGRCRAVELRRHVAARRNAGVDVRAPGGMGVFHLLRVGEAVCLQEEEAEPRLRGLERLGYGVDV